jgi:2-phosphosulfolactate phosphatase
LPSRIVVIDCFAESAERYRDDHVIVAVDVIRATTTAVTAVALGWVCFPVPSIDATMSLAATLPNPLLVGEVGGNRPYGFDLTNSPAELESRIDFERPMILLSTSGTALICAAEGAPAVYVACLRNYSAQAAHLARSGANVAIIGAGSRGEFRDEDELCCAWIAEQLVGSNYRPRDTRTAAAIARWRGAPIDAITRGASAEYLRRTGQERDLEFVLTHVDDLDDVYRYERGQIVKDPTLRARKPAADPPHREPAGSTGD